MNDLIKLLDQSFRTEIRNEIYNGVRDIVKVREQAEEMIQRMARKFKHDLTWEKLKIPTEVWGGFGEDEVKDEAVVKIIDHLLTYGDHCKDDLISDLTSDVAEKVQDKLDDYISANVHCQTLQDIIFDNIDVSGDAYEWVEDIVEKEVKKLEVTEEVAN
jgi:hypothetical protein